MLAEEVGLAARPAVGTLGERLLLQAELFGGEAALLQGLGVLGGPLLALVVEAGLGMVAPTLAGEGAGEVEEGGEGGGVVRRGGGGLLEAGAQGEGDEGGEAVGEGGIALVGLEAVGALEEAVEGLAGLLVAEPVGKAAEFPVGEVLLGDGGAGEFGGEDGLNGGEGVQPVDEELLALALVQAVVELVANSEGEAGDFTGAGEGHGDGIVAEGIVYIKKEY
jgi:hypothetical protein